MNLGPFWQTATSVFLLEITKIMTFKSLDRMQASIKLQFLLGMVRIRAGGNGLGQQIFQNIKEYLPITLGLAKPTYSQSLQKTLHLTKSRCHE